MTCKDAAWIAFWLAVVLIAAVAVASSDTDLWCVAMKGIGCHR